MEFQLLLTGARAAGSETYGAPGADGLLLVMQVSEGLPAFSADLAKSVIYPWTDMEIP